MYIVMPPQAEPTITRHGSHIHLPWRAQGLAGLQAACPRPTVLPFAVDHPVVQIACADEATLALTADGHVYHWGRLWLRPRGMAAAPTLLPELRDVRSISCTVPGYFHERRISVGYHCTAVTQRGELYTWGINLAGQLLHTGARYMERPTKVVESRPNRASHASAITPLCSHPPSCSQVTRFGPGTGELVRLAACGVQLTAVYTTAEHGGIGMDAAASHASCFGAEPLADAATQV